MQTQVMTDRQMIEEALDRNSDSFEELVRRYRPRLLRTLVRMVHNPEDAEDLAQETFLLAYRYLRSFRIESKFFTWLYQIAINVVRAYHRKKSRMVHTVDWTIENHSLSNVAPVFLIEDSVEREVLLNEKQRILNGALQDLDCGDRQLFLMKHVENKQYQTIADCLRIPIGTVRSRLHRVRKKLQGFIDSSIPSHRRCDTEPDVLCRSFGG